MSFAAFTAYLVEAATDSRGLGYRAKSGGMYLDVARRITGLIPERRESRPRECVRSSLADPPRAERPEAM
jgi:hypothetical protein